MFIIFSLGLNNSIQATHIVGGEMTYKCLGNNEYEITMVIFRDCFYGDPTAFFDDPAVIGIFDGVTNNLIDKISIPYDEMTNDTLDEVLTDTCLIVGPDLCVHSATYIDTVTLMPRAGGYLLAYQRCCRNQTILNIVNPVGTGGTYTTYISETALLTCNSAASFKDWPPLFVCVAEPIYWDHSAIDLDGDSLVYKFCTPLSGATLEEPEPTVPSNPPYDPVVWKSPYSEDNILGGTPKLNIDVHTGIITGSPEISGQFVVGVCVEEYRDGELISTSRRDFQYNVGQCIPTESIIENDNTVCDDLTIHFNNASTNASEFIWDFGIDGTNTDRSTEKNPSFTYPDTGHYTVMLISQPQSVCSDTIVKDFWLTKSTAHANFNFLTLKCDSTIIIGTDDVSYDDNADIVSWYWELSDGQTSTEENPTFVSNDTHDSLTLTLTVSDPVGCPNTIVKTFPSISSAPIGLVDGKNICVGDSIQFVSAPVFNSDFTYEWSPSATLDDPSSPNPVGFPTSTTMYSVVITHTASGCSNIFQKEIIVNDLSDIKINAVVTDTTTHSQTELTDISVVNNCENEVTTLTFENTFGVTNITSIQWTDDQGNVISAENTINVDPDSVVTYTIMITDSLGCTGQKTITIQGNPVDFNINEKIIDTNNDNISDFDINGDGYIDICIGTPFTLHINNNISTDTLSFIWSGDTDIITEGGQTGNPVLEPIEAGHFSLVVQVMNQYGCTGIDTILIAVADPFLDPKFSTDQTCDNLDVSFTFLNANYPYYQWHLGDGSFPITNKESFVHTYAESGVYEINLTPLSNFECGLKSLSKEIMVYPTNLDISFNANGSLSDVIDVDENSNTIISCEEEIITISSTTTTSAIGNYDIKWYDEDGNLIDGEEIMVEPGGTKTYTVVYTDDLGCSFEKQITVKGGPVDTKIIGKTITGPGGEITGVLNEDGTIDLCLGTSYQLVSENLDPRDTLSYNWTISDNSILISGANTNRPVFTPKEAGTFDIWVEVTNQFGCIKNDTLQLHVVDPNTILNFNYYIDCDGLTVHFTDVQTNGEAIIWTFIDGLDTTYTNEIAPTYKYSTVGLYDVTLSVDANVGCVEPHMKTVNIVDPILKSDFTFQYDSCSKDVLIINFFDQSINPQNNTQSYFWDFGPLGTSTEKNPTLEVFQDTTITVTLTLETAIGCVTTSKPVTLSLNLIEDFDWTPNLLFCAQSDSIMLNSAGNPNYLYQWIPSTGLSNSNIYNPMVFVDDNTDYHVIITDTTGGHICQMTKDLAISVSQIESNLPTYSTVCRNVDVELNPNFNNNFTYKWSPEDLFSDIHNPNPTVVSISPTMYHVAITDNLTGCTAYDSIFVDVSTPINLKLPKDTIGCEVIETELSIDVDKDVQIAWANDPFFNNIISTKKTAQVVSARPNIYYVTVRDENNCTETDSVIVADYHVDVELRKKYEICYGDSVEISVINLLATDQLEYQWEGPELLAYTPTVYVKPTRTTQYFTEVVNQYQCSQKDTVEVKLNREEPITSDIRASIDTIYKGNDSQLFVDTGYQYKWSPSITMSESDIFNPIVFPEETTEYQVFVSDSLGCGIWKNITVVVLQRLCEEPFIFFPTAFSPNGDGENDLLQLHGNDLEEVYWVVYNRWGQKVFEAHSIDDKWDGKFEGELVAPDVYGFYLETKCEDGEVFKKKGNVTVLR